MKDESNSKKTQEIVTKVVVTIFIMWMLVSVKVNIVIVFLIGCVLFTNISKTMYTTSDSKEKTKSLQSKEMVDNISSDFVKKAKEEIDIKLEESTRSDKEITFTYLVEHVDSLLLSYIIYLELYEDFNDSHLTREEFILMRAKTMARKIFESLGMEEPKFDMFPISTMYMKNNVFKDENLFKYI